MSITKSPLAHYKTIEEYQAFAKRLHEFKDEAEKVRLNRLLCRTDLFWLLWYACEKHYICKQWILERCKEVEAAPDGYLDLWSREHFKSTIITYGKSIQDILASHGDNPLPEWEREVTIGIFSVSRPLAKAFLREIKTTFETAEILKALFPDILYDKPQNQAVKWSEDEGIIVKRKGIFKESTVEAWGMVDSQPTGKHFYLVVYDDIVTQESVTSPETIMKTTNALGLSDNIGTLGGKYRCVGTPYAANDTLQHIQDQKIFKVRKHPGTFGGKWPIDNDSEAPLLTKEQLETKFIKQGVYNFSCQILLNPVMMALQNFKFEWLRYYGGWDRQRMTGNIYILIDPANSKKKSSDYTVFFVVAACSDGNIYVIDMVRDRLSLSERTDTLFSLVKIHRPIIVGYEQYGMMADIEHIKEKMEQLNYRFHIKELGGRTAKTDRIGRLIPDFQGSKIWLPIKIEKKNYDNKIENLVEVFVKEEYLTFPTPKHDDMLDCLARIKDEDMPIIFPLEEEEVFDDFSERKAFNVNRVTGY